MSILIKGAEMPKTCEECPCNDDSWRCGMLGRFEDLKGYETYWDLSKGRFSDCPLVEIPPHGRLIDASEMAIKFNCLDIDITTAKKLHEWLMEIPTVIESEEA